MYCLVEAATDRQPKGNPMFGTYNRLHVTIYDSNMVVLRAAWRKLNPKTRRNREGKEHRKQFYRLMLQYHQEACDLAREYRL
jgi:hypothetical protein